MAVKKKATKTKTRKVVKAATKKSSTKKVSSAKKTPVKKPAKKKVVTKKTTAKKATPKKTIKKSATKKATRSSAAKTKKVTPKKTVTKAKTKKVSSKANTTQKAAPKKKAVVRKAASKVTKKTTVRKNAKVSQAATEALHEQQELSSQATTMVAPALPGDIQPYQSKAKEDYMNSAQKAHFRNILETLKQELLDQAGQTVHHLQDDKVNYPDPTDRATQEEEFSVELRARDRERKLLHKITATQQRLENDDYGYCDACGEEIGVKRLEARPTATLCIDCKTLAEIKERQTGI